MCSDVAARMRGATCRRALCALRHQAPKLPSHVADRGHLEPRGRHDIVGRDRRELLGPEHVESVDADAGVHAREPHPDQSGESIVLAHHLQQLVQRLEQLTPAVPQLHGLQCLLETLLVRHEHDRPRVTGPGLERPQHVAGLHVGRGVTQGRHVPEKLADAQRERRDTRRSHVRVGRVHLLQHPLELAEVGYACEMRVLQMPFEQFLQRRHGRFLRESHKCGRGGDAELYANSSKCVVPTAVVLVKQN